MLESIWRVVAVGLVRVSREEQEREGLRAVGMGTWRKAYPVCFLLQNRGGSLVWCFPMPPIPIVLKRSILFLLAYCAVGSVDNQIMLLF